MASLTYTAHIARNIIKYGGIGIALFTVLWVTVTAGIKAYIAAHPPYEKPNVKYGKLLKVVFPEKKFEKKTFAIELPNDSLPKFKDQSRVYLITRSNNTFLALEQDKKTAKQLGFSADPKEIRPGVYEFSNMTTNQTLTMNVVEGSFRLKYPYENDQMLLNPEKVPSKAEAIQIAKSYLSSAGKYPKDIENGEKKVTFLKIEFDGLKVVSSQSEANAVRVDFFRSNVEEDFRIVTSDFSGASISVVTTGSTVAGKKVVEVNYRYANIDREMFATYPIKTVEKAIEELKAGTYWPAVNTDGNSTTIRRIYLAYFEPVTLTNYLQPVYVFEGDKNFVAYVPAVSDEWVK